MASDIDEIASQIPETLEDVISGNYCICQHLIEDEHFTGQISKTSKCYGLNFNGSAWISCKCTKIVVMEFNISTMVDSDAYFEQNPDSYAATAV